MYKELEDKKILGKFVERQNPKSYAEAFVYFNPCGYCLPPRFAEIRQTIRNFKVRNDDIWLVSLPKSGTTWAQEMIWLVHNNLDYEGANTLLNTRFPYLENEITGTWGRSMEIRESSTVTVQNMKSPRFIKTHLPFELLPKELETKKPKIIYVARNPKDRCVSHYHHKVLLTGYKGTMDDHVEEYLMDYYFGGPFWDHIRPFWDLRNEANFLFLTYEEMHKNLRSVVDKNADFLGKSLYSNAELEKLVQHLSFDSMKSNPAVNLEKITDRLTQVHGEPKKTEFMRKGKVGSWNEELSAESIQKLDKYFAKNKIDGLFESPELS